MPLLFSPLILRDITLKNRIVISPMCQYSAQEGFANDWHFIHLGSRAIGGAGLVMTEATAVSPEGRISPGDLGIWQNEHIEPLRRITDFIHAHGSIAGIQLAHAGHKASSHVPWNGGRLALPNEGGWQPVSSSAHALLGDNQFSEALSHDGIQKVVSDFIKATQRALSAGFKVIEIHAAHGYLLNGFLSPLVNQRTDEFGGSFENRTRLLLQIVTEVRAILPTELPLFIRLSATDWAEGGWTIDDSVALAGLLKIHGVDLIDCSSGGLVKPGAIPVGPGYQVPFAEAIKSKTGILTGAVGMITEAHQANEIIESQQADLILIARESLRDPYFPLRAAHELGVDVTYPVQYERAKRK
ncbi:NADH:flavin oxidoreductase/NADH oxidase [Runella sp.]|jgi:2,4-dienoyl-CoA reductase-like NADH-dependent reductase (Old Yellow Enzyme family)|uniref:NADH:flavin oxidoreductase/NADH oxidase n=1 Tax=Runella sp. TaxID=1960881 RepID=UPI00262D96AD|nr:NADH:flavin oxidoreductase/NADH oxidase [Runella sp.]